MSAVPSRNASAGRIGSRARAGIAALLLAAGLAGPAGNGLAAAAPEPVCQDPGCGEARPLDHLSVTIDGLKASLSAIRQDLETRRGETEQPAQAIEELCATPLADAHAARDAAMSALEQIRASFESERAIARDTVAATGDELSVVRERLAVAEAEAAQLRDERARLKSRIDELGALLEKVPTGELVAALAEPPGRGAALDAAQAAEVEAASERQLMMPVAAQAGPRSAAPARSANGAGGRRPAPPVDRLQLQAELALAQLKIAELTMALQSARLHQEQVEAEVSTLRSLTDAKIRQLMGWQ
ncbi:MAG TPA: hypothetical protein VFY19_11525 [Geminicoccaceae bacterium]|nr:hypothetical protein [Geminicoccaceae bacterium]